MFNLQGLLNTLFGYPINFITTPYMDSYNARIKNVLTQNNCVFLGGGEYNPELMTKDEIALMEKKNNELASKYYTCRDSLTKENTNSLDKTIRIIDAASGITALGALSILYYFNRDKISFSKFALGVGILGIGGIVVSKIKRNNYKKEVAKANENIVQKSK
jgi:hypothetical protein